MTVQETLSWPCIIIMNNTIQMVILCILLLQLISSSSDMGVTGPSWYFVVIMAVNNCPISLVIFTILSIFFIILLSVHTRFVYFFTFIKPND